MRMGEGEAHKHKCPVCGHIWEHTCCSRISVENEREATETHTCPVCGKGQHWFWYDENETDEQRAEENEMFERLMRIEKLLEDSGYTERS